jgi:hypothetical protein
VAEIGEPEKRRILVPEEMPQIAPVVVPERQEPEPAKVPEREPV